MTVKAEASLVLENETEWIVFHDLFSPNYIVSNHRRFFVIAATVFAFSLLYFSVKGYVHER